MLNFAKRLPKDLVCQEVLADLERVKWYLWHGNTYKALEQLYGLEIDIDSGESTKKIVGKLSKHICEPTTYIRNNRAYIPNYGDRYRNGEIISSAFVESTVNELISWRMSKKQQMRWTKEGAHLLLQARAKTLDGDLRDQFAIWYPAIASSSTASTMLLAKSGLSC